ncbi:MAG: hypothetical protein HQM08_13120 [Candidatus Riflebacteria bacterium]|nr:hypothetical protein [Candidatus Riflebacteria bacterium]
MNSRVLSKNKMINMMLIFSMLASFFILPVKPVHAGLVSSALTTLGPLLSIAGRVGGAVLGASLCSAFCPPIGMIAGAIGGWVVGGALTDYATGSVGNLATVAGGIVGALAMGPGFMGMAGGFLLGSLVGMLGISVLKCVDNAFTGGLLLDKSAAAPVSVGSTGALPVANSGGGTLSPAGFSPNSGVTLSPSGFSPSGNIQLQQSTPSNSSSSVQQAEANYRKAYQDYVDITNAGGDSTKLKAAQDNYLNALKTYKSVVGNMSK